MKVVSARASQHGLFRRLWRDFLREQVELGADIIPSPRTMDFYSLLYASYLDGRMKGTAVFAGREGVLLWGEALYPFDRVGSPAMGWGTYVTPKHRGQGLSRQMREMGKRHLHELGFTSVEGAALHKNDVGASSFRAFGGHPFQTIWRLEL